MDAISIFISKGFNPLLKTVKVSFFTEPNTTSPKSIT